MTDCAACRVTPWTLPLIVQARPSQYRLGSKVPLYFEEWLFYHLHVVLHQGGVMLS